MERHEGDEGRSLWRALLLFFALLSVVIWLTNSFLSRPAWAPSNGLVSIAATTSYLTKLSMLSLVLIVPHRCIIIVCALICCKRTRLGQSHLVGFRLSLRSTVNADLATVSSSGRSTAVVWWVARTSSR